MSILELSLIAVGLSADAFAVSLSNGLCMKHKTLLNALKIALAFGFFQAFMPLCGFLLGTAFTVWIKRFDHFVALAFLGFIGGKMVLDGYKAYKEPESCELNMEITFGSLMMQAIATSIDALVIGVSFIAMNMGWDSVFSSVLFIGLITFVLSLIGVKAGEKFGDLLGSRAQMVGGLVLVGFGLKVFIEHTFFGS
jgi:putative Mn2+ efflux pump MntP